MPNKWPDFGKELNQARRRARLTQQELADQVGEALKITINQQTVSYWCRGENMPRGRDCIAVVVAAPALIPALCQRGDAGKPHVERRGKPGVYLAPITLR